MLDILIKKVADRFDLITKNLSSMCSNSSKYGMSISSFLSFLEVIKCIFLSKFSLLVPNYLPMNPEGKGQTIAAMNQRIRKTSKNNIHPLLNPRNLTLSKNFVKYV